LTKKENRRKIHKKEKIKTMMRRVNLGSSFSELVIVRDQYDTYVEEQLGVANRNSLGK
jgi:hypothetical protein